MPYEMGADGVKGMLLINKTPLPRTVILAGVQGGVATAVEVDASLSEPGFAPPVVKVVSEDGVVELGPFAVTVVTQLVL
jgi:hypothetical protein